MELSACESAGLGAAPAAVEACQLYPSSACFAPSPNGARPALRLQVGQQATFDLSVANYDDDDYRPRAVYMLYTMPSNNRKSVEIRVTGTSGGSLITDERAWDSTSFTCAGVCRSQGIASSPPPPRHFHVSLFCEPRSHLFFLLCVPSVLCVLCACV